MAPDTAEGIIKELIALTRSRLEDAAGLALAAEADAESGRIGKAVEIANEIDGPAHEAGLILGVIALIGRRHFPRSPRSEVRADSPAVKSAIGIVVSIHDLLRLVRECIDLSVVITKEAERQAIQRSAAAVTTLLGIEQLLYEATTLVNAASLINRISSS